MDGSILQVGLLALVGAMIMTIYEMRSALRPVACSECSHCRARAESEAREQERLSNEYARRIGLDDDDNDRRRT